MLSQASTYKAWTQFPLTQAKKPASTGYSQGLKVPNSRYHSWVWATPDSPLNSYSKSTKATLWRTSSFSATFTAIGSLTSDY